MEILIPLFIMLLSLISEGFFSGSEIGIVSADRLKLRQKASKGSNGAKLALRLLEKPEWLLSTTLVGTNIAVVTNTTVATALMIELFGEEYSWLAIMFVAPLIWIFGEIVPKSVFQQKSDEITPVLAYILRFFSILFYPILLIFSFSTRLFTKLVGEKKSNIFTLREQIISMLHLSKPGGEVHPAQGKMIRHMFRFSETPAIHVMVPLIDVVSVDKTALCRGTVRLATSSARSNLLVHDQRVDRVVGMVRTLELLGVDREQPITQFIRPVKYISGGKNVQHLLRELRQIDETFAVVVDEFGAARGIVTVEDIMEEVVSDMYDEFDVERGVARRVRKLGDQDFIVSGRIERQQLKDELGIRLRTGEFATLAGYLLEKTHNVPPEGTVIKSHGINYTIKKATDSAILEVRVKW